MTDTKTAPSEPTEHISRDAALSAIQIAFADHRAAIRAANQKRGGGITMSGHEMLGRADVGEAVATEAIRALAAAPAHQPDRQGAGEPEQMSDEERRRWYAGRDDWRDDKWLDHCGDPDCKECKGEIPLTQPRLAAPPPPADTAMREARSGFYVASRASVPERSAMWRMHRDRGQPIISTWIDEAGEGESHDLGDLWERIAREVTSAAALILYASAEDFPLKGAFVEVGMALAAKVPIFVVLDGVNLEPRSLRPLGSWAKHPSVTFAESVSDAFRLATLSRRDAAEGRG